jgi:N-acyl-D-aspartate/D-glutamate deacylase
MLSRVEGMSADALGAGLGWRGGGFGDFWRRLDGRIGVNAGAYVGHSAVRRFVMGDDASQRAARGSEIAHMQELVRQAMREGALGFSSSSSTSRRPRRREVPSNSPRRRSCGACAGWQTRPRAVGPSRAASSGCSDADRELICTLAGVSGRPISPT